MSATDETCICDRGPNSDGPEEDCPIDGRPYAYWVERSDALAKRLVDAETLADQWDALANGNEAARGTRTKVAAYYRKHAAELRAALRPDAES
jgi:hypothetical protein